MTCKRRKARHGWWRQDRAGEAASARATGSRPPLACSPLPELAPEPAPGASQARCRPRPRGEPLRVASGEPVSSRARCAIEPFVAGIRE